MTGAVHVLGRQWQQLDMFRPAHELMDSSRMRYLDASHYRDHDDMWDSKVSEAQSTYSSLASSIEQSGIKQPVAIAHNAEVYPKQLLADGHHRVAVAHELDRNYLVPVEHHDNHREFWHSRGRIMGDVGHTGEYADDDSGGEGLSYHRSGRSSEVMARARKHWGGGS